MPVMRKSLISRFFALLSLAAFLHLSVLAPLAPCLAGASEESCGLTQAASTSERSSSTISHDHGAMGDGDSHEGGELHAAAGGHCEAADDREDNEAVMHQCSHHSQSPADGTPSLYCNCHKHADKGETANMAQENRYLACASAVIFPGATKEADFAADCVPAGIIPDPPDRPPLIS